MIDQRCKHVHEEDRQHHADDKDIGQLLMFRVHLGLQIDMIRILHGSLGGNAGIRFRDDIE